MPQTGRGGGGTSGLQTDAEAPLTALSNTFTTVGFDTFTHIPDSVPILNMLRVVLVPRHSATNA